MKDRRTPFAIVESLSRLKTYLILLEEVIGNDCHWYLLHPSCHPSSRGGAIQACPSEQASRPEQASVEISTDPKPGAGTREPESVCEEHCPSDQWPRRTQTQTLLSSINIQTAKHLKQYGLLLNIDFQSSSWKLVLKPLLYNERCFKLTDPLSVHLIKIVNRYWKLQMIGYNLAAWLSRLQDDNK